jgi:hypothetical protein
MAGWRETLRARTIFGLAITAAVLAAWAIGLIKL